MLFCSLLGEVGRGLDAPSLTRIYFAFPLQKIGCTIFAGRISAICAYYDLQR